MERHWDRKDDGPDNPESSRHRDVHSQGRTSESISKDAPVLRTIHKIFLSHSGAQKDFVEELCGELERRYHFPFFDRRPSSLPKGERFPELILKAAQHCEMAVVVVSEEYFTSKWPMIELNTFVQTRLMQEKQKLCTRLKILPLFYGLSVVEFGSEKRRAEWCRRWEDLGEKDSRIDVSEWKECLKVLGSFNGIEYQPSTKALKVYREEIVNQICREVLSDVKWDDSHVQGGSNICEVILNKLSQIEPSNQFGVSILGIYGVGGIGKTTLCKSLCNRLFKEFKGKVSYVDLGLEESSVKGVVKNLTNYNQEFLQQLDEGHCWDVLHNDMCKQETFLALDNVWPSSKSLEEAKKYLRTGFHKGSVVLVTSRALKTLTYLGISESECLEMPSLGHEDAKNLFLHHAAFGIQFPNDEDKQAIEECVKVCYFRKGNGNVCHYVPLALKALGGQLGCVGKRPSEWVRALPKVRDFNYLQEQVNPVFSILRSSFDCLQPIYKSLFMDVALYYPTDIQIWAQKFPDMGLMKWLIVLYNRSMEEIESMLQYLIGRGLLEDVDMTLQRVRLHDLYREFAKLEAQGKLSESAEFKKRSWVYCRGDDYPTELGKIPAERCWSEIIRISVQINYKDENLQKVGAKNNFKIEKLLGIKWGYFSNVEVLKLEELGKLRGELNVKGLNCLRSLELFKIKGLDEVHGLEDLSKLAYFRWYSYGCTLSYVGEKVVPRRIMEQLPPSLIALELFTYSRGYSLRRDVFARCTNLTTLELKLVRDKHLDFGRCASLQSVCIGDCKEVKNLDFSGCPSLQTVLIERCVGVKNLVFSTDCSSLQTIKLDCLTMLTGVAGLSSKATSNLQILDVKSCNSLVEIPGLGQMVGLQRLCLCSIHKLRKLPDLRKLTRLQMLKISRMIIEEVPSLSRLGQLRELRWTCSFDTPYYTPIKLPSLSGFEQLEIVDLSCNFGMSSLEGVCDNIPGLRRLNLRECRSVSRLPDLSRAKNLEDLDLQGSGIELREEDMCMLAALPLLHPVLVGSGREAFRPFLRLDVVRRKVLHPKTRWGRGEEAWREWDERDLGLLPIKAECIS